MTMTEKERDIILPELLNIVANLPKEEQQHLAWIGEGILIGSRGENDRK